MADDDSRDTFRLSLMQDVLPVGMAVVERVRNGGGRKLVEAFTSSDDPLQELKREGESAAKTLREQLDKVSPGLGNPVVPVEVAVEITNPKVDQSLDYEPLMQCLDRIQIGIEELEILLLDDSLDKTTSMPD